MASGVAVLVLIYLTSTACAQNAQNVRIEWPPDFPASEKREVLALAKQMGIDEPAKVSMGVVAVLGDPFVTVDSAVSVTGHERRWMRANMFRHNWRGPDDAPRPELRRHRVGRWIAMGESERVTMWRIHDGNWFVDPAFRGDVAYDDAERIVLAIRRGTLLNRLPEQTVNGAVWKPPLPRFDSGRVTQIEKEGSSQDYKVTYSRQDLSGHELHVRITDEGVEVIAVYLWEV